LYVPESLKSATGMSPRPSRAARRGDYSAVRKRKILRFMKMREAFELYRQSGLVTLAANDKAINRHALKSSWLFV
jgi:hypothetical protein